MASSKSSIDSSIKLRKFTFPTEKLPRLNFTDPQVNQMIEEGVRLNETCKVYRPVGNFNRLGPTVESGKFLINKP